MFERDEEVKKKHAEEFFGKTFPRWCEVLQKRVEENSSPNYIVGDKITIADFAMAAVAYATFLNDNFAQKDLLLGVVEKYPKLLEYFRHLGEVDLKDYLQTRKASPW